MLPPPSPNMIMMGTQVRVMRALQLPQPILLEGSPGVGKTSLISALAKASGHTLVRINLSEQTDIADLLGCDLPVGRGQEDSAGPDTGEGMYMYMNLD
jgi:midasin (ATPase involved in ribosome maturation)